MRRILIVLTLCLLGACLYVASPFVTAWYIRDAIRAGNAAYLADKVDWLSLKHTLKPSLSRLALDMPLEPEAVDAPKPSLWKRIKAKLGAKMVDRAVDGYVTPEGLTQLFSLRQAYRKHVASAPAAADEAGRPLVERIRLFWSRVQRAEFTRLTRFELDVVDKHAPDRLFAGVMELRGFDWKLTELRIREAKGGAPAGDAGAATDEAAQSRKPDATDAETPSPSAVAGPGSRAPLAATASSESSPQER